MTGKEETYELHMQLMQDAVIQLLLRGIDRTNKMPKNGYRRRLYFEGMALLGQDLSLIASAGAFLVRAAGNDLQTG